MSSEPFHALRAGLPVRVLLAMSFLAWASVANAAPEIRVYNEAQMPEPLIRHLSADFSRWAARVYAFNHVRNPAPVNLAITDRVGIGYYSKPTVYMPPDNLDSMLETWVHELAHHATGHGSNFFFKEGIATGTLESLFAEDDRIPQGWPQYGQPNDAWVKLFALNGELPALADLIAWRGYDGSSHDTDFRSWQVYVIGGSFIGWLIRNEGYQRFWQAFRARNLGADARELESRWLDYIKRQPVPDFDPYHQLPDRARYQYYAQRLG